MTDDLLVIMLGSQNSLDNYSLSDEITPITVYYRHLGHYFYFGNLYRITLPLTTKLYAMVGNYRDYVTMAFREQGNKYSLQKMGYTFQSQMSHFPALGTRVTATDRRCRPLLHAINR